MKIKILFIILLNSVIINAQITLSQKYDNYRVRFNSKFCVPGSGKGQGIPMSTRETVFSSNSINHWGDAGISLGWYIGMLATEYEIKKINNQNYSQTVHELYLALNTINRLDSVAEIYYGGVSDINGFFIRDDVSPSMIYATNAVNPIFFNSDSCIVSNYACGSSYCLPLVGLCLGNLDNEESQDQFYHLMMGLSLCAKYCNENYGGINLSARAKETTDRLINYIKQNAWIIKNPVSGNNVSRGENTTAYCNGIAKAGFNITGLNYDDATTTGFAATSSWNIFPTINFPVGASLTADNVHMFLATAAVANDSRSSVDSYALSYKMEIYPLLRQVMYGGPNLIPDSVYTNLLNKADENGNYYYSPTSRSTGGTWYSENMFVWPNRNMASAAGTNTLSFSFGEYHGLDFMLLYNLVQLKQLTLGYSENNLENTFVLYPNPTNSNLKIKNLLNKEALVCFYDLHGRLLSETKLNAFHNEIELKEGVLPSGVYIYKVFCESKEIKNEKVIICR
jgi:hypothetical protein